MNAEKFKKRFLLLNDNLYKYALRYLGNGDDAADAVQTLYLKLWEKRDALDAVDNDEAYCFAVLKNICAEHWRHIRYDGGEEEMLEVAYDQRLDVEMREERDYVSSLIERLPQVQRKIIIMLMQGCGNDEIVKMTGLSEVHVRVLLSRARKVLRILYKKRG